MVDLFKNIEFAAPLAQAIVDTVREPILCAGSRFTRDRS